MLPFGHNEFLLTTELVTVLLEERDIGLAVLEGRVGVLESIAEIPRDDILHLEWGWSPTSAFNSAVKELL